jgi:nucleoside 2-deoxyribosyltransferase
MKIYFAGSIRGGRDDRELYIQIIEHLKQYGAVLTEHIGDGTISHLGEVKKNTSFIYDRDVAWLRSADAVVAEVTTPSLGVGYEIALAESLKKPILCLFRKQEDRLLSAMIAGNKSLTVQEYVTIEDIETILSEFFKK